jgi:protein-tyrosine phosphatase
MCSMTTMRAAKVKVLFVCMGNICRSPTAQGVFCKLVEEAGLTDVVEVDSAGTHAYHVGEPPDRRAQQTALRRGIDLSQQHARRIEPEDLQYYDYILVMDQDNYHAVSAIYPEGLGLERRLMLLLDYAPHLRTREVPDPYYGGANGFESVFDMVEAAAAALLDDIRRKHL